MRLIGVPVADRPECLRALEVAFALGKKFSADVKGYHVIPNHVAAQKISMSSLLNVESSASLWPQDSLKSIKSCAVSARKVFAKMAEASDYPVYNKHGSVMSPHAVFKEKVGAPEKIMPLIGPLNDLLIVSRPEKSSSKKASIILMTALMNTAAPVLVLPHKKVKLEFNRVAIAWNRGQTESVLVHYSLPLLRKAEDVVLINEGRDHKYGPTVSEMTTFLRAHDVPARFKKIIGKDTGKALVKTAIEEKAEVIMCGAYTRGKTREVLFGGVTEYLLKKSNLPIVMMHF